MNFLLHRQTSDLFHSTKQPKHKSPMHNIPRCKTMLTVGRLKVSDYLSSCWKIGIREKEKKMFCIHWIRRKNSIFFSFFLVVEFRFLLYIYTIFLLRATKSVYRRSTWCSWCFFFFFSLLQITAMFVTNLSEKESNSLFWILHNSSRLVKWK